MLASLHVALVLPGGLGDPLVRGLMLAHCGLFLLWQPFLSRDRSLSAATISLIVLCGLAILFFLTGWFVVVWVAGLIGILGGRSFSSKLVRRRLFYLLALFYLFVLLLLWAVPTLITDAPIPAAMTYLIRFALPILLLVLMLVPLQPDDPQTAQGLDFFYSLLFFQLVSLLVLGTLACMNYTGNDYYLALFFTIVGVSGALFLLALLWNPSLGFAGLRTYFSRYLLSVGVPFESWLQQVAERAEQVSDPADFLGFGMGRLAELPWVQGGVWRAPDGDGEFGIRTRESAKFLSHDLEITLYTKVRLSPALLLHVRLLTQLMGEFYEAKRREGLLKQNAYMQAVHETGARMTHDIKNLLQSLYSLASAGQLLDPDQTDAYAQMVQRQLPHLTKRLQATLDKLHTPSEQAQTAMVSAREWWDGLKVRYGERGVNFSEGPYVDRTLPRTLFDSVAENLLENALRKRGSEPGVEVRVQLVTDSQITLHVADTGTSVPPNVARALFKEPISAAAGMGIGLYQASRQAQKVRYNLQLSRNLPGDVCFSLMERA
jgi:signal transduction histidine kinase